MSTPSKCQCGSPAKFLCDAVVGLTPAEIKARALAGVRVGFGASRTCDAPLCDSCRVQVGNTFVCARGKPCVPGSVDRCPEHAPKPEIRVLPSLVEKRGR